MGEQFRRGMAAPNFMCVCMDSREDAGSRGRLYSLYEREPQRFENEYHLLKLMERLMDAIDYPQASVRMRSYSGKGPEPRREKRPCVPPEEVAAQRGACATLLVHVQYRQNATWQGEAYWMERKRTQTFRSALEFLKLLDSAR